MFYAKIKMMIFLVICPPSTLPPKQFTKFLFDFFVILKGRKTRIKKNKLGNNNIKNHVSQKAIQNE